MNSAKDFEENIRELFRSYNLTITEPMDGMPDHHK
jgi:hypothetical protein